MSRDGRGETGRPHTLRAQGDRCAPGARHAGMGRLHRPWRVWAVGRTSSASSRRNPKTPSYCRLPLSDPLADPDGTPQSLRLPCGLDYNWLGCHISCDRAPSPTCGSLAVVLSLPSTPPPSLPSPWLLPAPSISLCITSSKKPSLTLSPKLAWASLATATSRSSSQLSEVQGTAITCLNSVWYIVVTQRGPDE